MTFRVREKRMGSTDFQRKIGGALDDVRVKKTVIVVEWHGRGQVAVVPIEVYERLSNLQSAPTVGAPRADAEGEKEP